LCWDYPNPQQKKTVAATLLGMGGGP
jgi:hypothetical protein